MNSIQIVSIIQLIIFTILYIYLCIDKKREERKEKNEHNKHIK